MMGIETTFLGFKFEGIFPLVTEHEIGEGRPGGPWIGFVNVSGFILGAPHLSYSGFVGVSVAAMYG